MKMSFMNTTNNRLESLNGKIKSITTKFATLEQFIIDFFILISTRNSEHDVVAAYSYLKTKALPFGEGSPEHFYNRILISYGFQFVRKELDKRFVYKITGLSSNTGTLSVQRDGSTRIRNVTHNKCDCNENLLMGLPCRHIFAVREHLDYSLMDASLCLERWTQKYYMDHERAFEDPKDQPEPSVNITAQKSTSNRNHTLTHGRKLKIGKEELLGIGSLLAEFSTPKFWEYIQFFEEVFIILKTSVKCY
ncbi:uncharacterized protein LOC122503339 [Leptopilina heterotoma]|uniref:uncharacterized protein LOC122503339 n=1 Tax=Leptopilina heterotoma TaxID=63436 RepID=UPI001CA8147D|nr:uncharacterized protein LOC122503339 [Leptopilina heterotoma]